MAGLLVVDGVWKGFSRGGREWVPVLEDVSLVVERGEVVAVVGGRLGGKSTLLQVAAGMEPADVGSVRLGEVELGALSGRARSRLLGHDVVWLDRDGPALELVEVSRFVGWPLALSGGRRHAERRALQMLERVGARACVGRRWGELSNWQRVLVGLARAFAGCPRVVIIDDLLDALGSHAGEEAFDLLRSLMEQADPACGVLMSASDLDSAIFADRVWSLGNGKLQPMAGHQQENAHIIPFPEQESHASRSVGCS